MAGKWRWMVSAQLSLVTAGRLDVLDARVEVPVFLQFGNDDASDALVLAAPSLNRHLERLLDTSLRSAAAGELGVRDDPAPQAPARAGGLIYFAMVDRFSNGDPGNDAAIDLTDPTAFHGGDLRGLIDRLDHLEGLGVKTLWLSPVFAMRTEDFGDHGAFHGYWLEDPYRVEPRFGTEADLRELAAGLDARGMGLYLDMVNNHVAYDSPHLESHPHWFHGLGDIEDWSSAEEVENHDVHGLPDLDQSNEEVRDWLVGAGLHWIDAVRPAGFRLDAVRHVSQSFWEDYNSSMRQAGGSDFVLAGELFDGDPAMLASTWRGGGFTAMFDFPLYYALVDVFCGDAAPGRLVSVLWADRLYDNPERLITFIDNHDLPRAVSACGGSAEPVAEMLRFLFSIRGTPAITWGTEAALAGGGEPGNRADMPWDGPTPLLSVIKEAPNWRPVNPGGRVIQLDSEGFTYLRADGILLRLASGVVSLERGGDRPSQSGVEEGSVRVRVAGSPVGPGDRLLLVGAGPELGGWQPTNGIELPIEGIELPAGAVLDFKLVVVKQTGETIWEDRGNRYALVEPGLSLDLQLDWGA